MIITAGEIAYTLSTKLGTAAAIELKFGKQPLMQIMGRIDAALTSELIDILSVAAGQQNNKVFAEELMEHWDYTDLQLSVQELLARLMFSGTPEEIERKLNRYPSSDEQKNAFRELLGLPMATTAPAEDSTGAA